MSDFDQWPFRKGWPLNNGFTVFYAGGDENLVNDHFATFCHWNTLATEGRSGISGRRLKEMRAITTQASFYYGRQDSAQNKCWPIMLTMFLGHFHLIHTFRLLLYCTDTVCLLDTPEDCEKLLHDTFASLPLKIIRVFCHYYTPFNNTRGYFSRFFRNCQDSSCWPRNRKCKSLSLAKILQGQWSGHFCWREEFCVREINGKSGETKDVFAAKPLRTTPHSS